MIDPVVSVNQIKTVIVQSIRNMRNFTMTDIFGWGISVFDRCLYSPIYYRFFIIGFFFFLHDENVNIIFYWKIRKKYEILKVEFSSLHSYLFLIHLNNFLMFLYFSKSIFINWNRRLYDIIQYIHFC